jgi:L-ascorbate metabolism protein UlaG (beta-lactamase superfamily)
MKRHLSLSSGSLGAVLAVITAAAAEDAPWFSPLQLLTNREAALRLNGSTGVSYRVEVSANLEDWAGLVSFPMTNSFQQHTDSAAPRLSSRHYRALRLSGTNLFTGDHVATTNGDAIIRTVNHPSFVLSWNGQTVYNDPVGSSRFVGLPRADVVLVTHEHGDHLDVAAINSVTNTNAVIIAPWSVYAILPASLQSITTRLTNGSSATAKGILIEALPAYNTTASYHLKGTGNGYLLTLGGTRVYISGDTEDTPEMRALRNVDVAFLAMNKPYTMSVSQAVSAVRAFIPRVVYPNHFQPSTPVTDLESFKSQLMDDPGVEVRLRKWY